MPLTFPAHQAVVLPLKQRWPTHFDGVALVIGAAAPDLVYALGTSRSFAHSWGGMVVSALLAALYTIALKTWALPGVFRWAPTVNGADLSVFGGATLGVPRSRALAACFVSALIGSASHVAWDLFTHAETAPSLLRLDTSFGSVGSMDLTIAQILQGTSHLLGSAFTLWWLHDYASTSKPSSSRAAVASRRLGSLPTIDSILRPTIVAADSGRAFLWLFGGTTAAGLAVGLAVGRPLFVIILAHIASALVVGAVIEWRGHKTFRGTQR
jgi:membrane-bound metal-dependent hydrolase YbcI (DUF457 family)